MRVKKARSNINSQKIAFYFVLCIFALLFVSFIFRAIILLSKSKFDGYHRFTILITKQKENALISLEPSSHTLSIVDLPEGPGKFPVSSFLEIPIDGNVTLTTESQNSSFLDLIKKEVDIGGKDISLMLFKIVFEYNKVKTDLTIMDVIRFAWFSKTVPKNMVKYVAVSKNLTESSIDRISNSFFADSSLQKENATVAIVNSAGVSGLGNRLARLITNMGGSVVAVSTGKTEEEASKIIRRTKESYTLLRISQVTGFSISDFTPTAIPLDTIITPKEDVIDNQDSFVSDIIIVIGKDALKNLVF